LRHPAVLLLILLLIAGITWLLLDAPTSVQDETGADQSAGHQLDYYLRGMQATTLGADGRPTQKLQSAAVNHYADDDTTEFEAPHLSVFEGEHPPWEIRADRAWMSADGELMLLQDRVTIDRPAFPGNPPLHLVTANVRVQPNQGYAETDEAVRVRSNQDWLDATGMQAWLNEPSRIKLLADVKGFYALPE